MNSGELVGKLVSMELSGGVEMVGCSELEVGETSSDELELMDDVTTLDSTSVSDEL